MVGMVIALLEDVILVLLKIMHDIEPQNLVNVQNTSDQMTPAWTDVLVEHKPFFLVHANCIPSHDACSSFQVPFHDRCMSKLFAPPSPHPSIRSGIWSSIADDANVDGKGTFPTFLVVMSCTGEDPNWMTTCHVVGGLRQCHHQWTAGVYQWSKEVTIARGGVGAVCSDPVVAL